MLRRKFSRPSAEALASLVVERLEERWLLSSAAPSSFDQYMLELINRARANPAQYAASLGISLNEGLPAGTISPQAKQPLAFNGKLIDAAQKHTNWMLRSDTFSHTGAGGSSAASRMTAAGYQFTGAWGRGENIGYRGTTESLDRTQFTRQVHESLFVNRNNSGRGHRRNILNPVFAEVGIGVQTGDFRGYNTLMVTQDFAKSGTTLFLTGVVYNDTVVRNHFYTPGEGLGGVTIRAVRDGGGRVYTTKSWSSGGYTLALPPGRYSILASGSRLSRSQFLPAVTIGQVNRKLDFVDGTVREAPEVALFGKGKPIDYGDAISSLENGTHFGSVKVVNTSVTRLFEIKNWGNATLRLTSTAKVVVSGPQAADFTVTLQPATSIAGNSTTTFRIRFNPSAAGVRTALISFANNDGNENPFHFTVSGTGLAPANAQASLSGGFSASSLTFAAEQSISPANLQTLPDGVGARREPASFVSPPARSTTDTISPAILEKSLAGLTPLASSATFFTPLGSRNMLASGRPIDFGWYNVRLLLTVDDANCTCVVRSG